jgi:hypothetical protein
MELYDVNTRVCINLEANPRIILMTEEEKQKIIIWTREPVTQELHALAILSVTNPGRYEICLCKYTMTTIWQTDAGDMKIVPGGGIMSRLNSKVTGTKIMIHYKNIVPSLKYLCHKSVSRHQEKTMRKFPDAFKASLMLSTKEGQLYGPDGEINPDCRCHRRKSLPELTRKLFKNFKDGTRKFFLFTLFLFLFVCE